MRAFTSPIQVARHLLATDQGWVLLVEVPLRTLGTFRLVKGSHHLEVGGYAWQAAGITLELPPEDAEGSLGEVVVTLPNASRVPMAYIEAVDEVLGQVLTCHLWNTALDPADAPQSALSWKAKILKSVATVKAVRLECGHPAQAQRAPGPVFGRDRFPGLLPSGGISLIGD